MQVYDVLVVGGGVSGLTAASLLAKQGYSVLVCEGSNELGGCAGKFDRSGYRFAVGATLGMGFEEGGVLRKLYEQLNIPLPLMESQNVIMEVHLPDQTISYKQSATEWYAELRRQFPLESERMIAFYEEIFLVGRRLAPLLDSPPIFPPRTMKNFTQTMSQIKKEQLLLAPFLVQTVSERLKKYDLLNNRAFVHFINGQLIDSVQTTAEHCPAFLGYAALQTFHRGAYYVYGGLATIAEDLAQSVLSHGGKVEKRQSVINISKKQSLWEVRTNKEIFLAKKLILSQSLHNVGQLFDDSWKKQIRVKEEEEKKRPAWGAFTAYIGVRDQFSDPSIPLYHQFINSYDVPMAEGNQFLLSMSRQEDLKVAPRGYRAITLSTHTEPNAWWQKERYQERKQMYMDQMLKSVNRIFPLFSSCIESVLPGTPVTFQRFTQRQGGKVGGYIPTGRWSWLKAYSPDSGVAGLWFCGDTVFPGAGTLAAVISGTTAARNV
ncbi:FAD-dependent oxidoreductase [Ammoniphilus sp. CFH 90114]|uniref:FAD-dependent oxidoreductase n=1 Tax=Ammoniphilus sp. CFH 90114 TaxID=2493665 RepID=UPI00100ECDF6|nr:FAD-dependent oxidoreductase [Ammoniphilus sp. CFH 90114]RXT06581.1 FAD-dependent oxidoreductase [Ammoniphilus sp. CFH 90114]